MVLLSEMLIEFLADQLGFDSIESNAGAIAETDEFHIVTAPSGPLLRETFL